jgi:amidohydrolase
MSSILETATSLQEELVAIRRRLHSQPELSFREFETSAFIAEKLTGFGYKVLTGIGQTGMIAEIGDGKTVAIRCDMDALPVMELNRTVYTSKVAGVMHACGHDAHVACLLGAASILAKSQLPGRLRIILQPGEEAVDDNGDSGAAKMIGAGALANVSAIIGLHVDTTVSAGKVGIVAGMVMPATEDFTVEIDESACDSESVPIFCAKTVLALAELSTANVADEITVSIHSIRTPLSQAERATIKGTIKTFGQETQERIRESVRAICESAEVTFDRLLPTTINNQTVTEVMHAAAVDLIGEANVLSIKRRSWAAEFSLYTQLVPGAFMFLGAEIPGSRRGHHSQTFDINESCLAIGAAVLAETALRLMAAP